jgi:hypothetical protein
MRTLTAMMAYSATRSSTGSDSLPELSGIMREHCLFVKCRAQVFRQFWLASSAVMQPSTS